MPHEPPAEPTASAGDPIAGDAASTAEPERRATAALLLVALAALAVPVWLVAIPPLLDYPNHLVRLWLIAGGADIAPLSKMYAVSWSSAFTNVGIDYLGAVLGRVVPAIQLGSFFLLLALLLPPLGAAALNRASFGGTHWWQIGFVFFAWSATLIAGFLNFHIGIGGALLSAALEPRLARAGLPLRLGAKLALASLLLFIHLFALLFYCALLAGLATGRRLSPLATRCGVIAAARGVAVAVAPAALPALLFIALVPALPGAHVDAAGNAPLWDFSLLSKLHVLLTPVVTYERWIDLALLVAILAPLAWALLAGRVEAHAGLMLAAAGLFALGLAAPTALAGTWWIDNRFPVMAALALIAGLRPDLNLRSAGRIAVAAALTLAVTARTAWIGSIWHEREADVRALQRAVAYVPAGAALLPLDNADARLDWSAYPVGRYFHNGHPTHWSLSALAIMWRRAFVPNLFWAAGKQPLCVLPPWDEISFPEDGLWPAGILTDPRRTPEHFRRWRERYDYVLLLNADVGRGADLNGLASLQLVRDEGFARLYRVLKIDLPS
jgi:hypothetical protein